MLSYKRCLYVFLRWFFYWRLLDHWPSFCLNHLILKCYSRKFKIQWGSEIRLSLDFKWSKRGRVANGLDFEWDLKSRSPTIWNPDKLPPFFQKPFEIRTKMSGYIIFGTIAKALPFENWNFWNLTFKKSGFQILKRSAYWTNPVRNG